MRNRKPNKHEFLINHQIKHRTVRIVGRNVENGLYDKSDAINLAEKMDLDLILINGKNNPPICRIEDQGKMIFEIKKKERELKRKTRESMVELKEIRLTPNTDTGDLSHKLKKAEEFLSSGNKVRFTVKFRGRQIQHKEPAEITLLEIAEKLSSVSAAESMPKMEGRSMKLTLKPKSKK
tara:strand:+ start:1269 stop:1805 length:537 start_codon:yes stop_codon:yes gene_type:complete